MDQDEKLLILYYRCRSRWRSHNVCWDLTLNRNGNIKITKLSNIEKTLKKKNVILNLTISIYNYECFGN
jgi:hypothetical protein